jgi:hypothetical protein
MAKLKPGVGVTPSNLGMHAVGLKRFKMPDDKHQP